MATVVQKHIVAFHLPYLKYFQDNGYETHVCANNDYENKEDCVIPYCDVYHDLPFSRSPFGKSNLEVYFNLKKIIEFNKFDIIHCHTPMGGVLARLAAKKQREKGTKVIYTAHGFHFYKGAAWINWLLYYPIEKYLSKFTDALITINSEDYRRALHFSPNQVYYVKGVGVNLSKVNNIAVNRDAKRSELKIKSETLIFVSVGELNRNKNHNIVIRALAQMKDLDFHYIICGKGPLETELKQLVLKLGLFKKVSFLGYRKDVLEIVNCSDVFVFPSFREGLSLALMEAMAVGLPIICSKIRGNIDLVKENINGVLFNPYNENELASKLQLFLSKIDTTNYKENNMINIDSYSLEKVTIRMSEIYRQQI